MNCTLLLAATMIFSVPDVDSDFKSYMDYRAITNRHSDQYMLQQECSTDPDTGIRVHNGYYCIALGTYYSSTIGERFKITLDTGEELLCEIGDIKADCHTDDTNRYVPCNGNIVEFIVDTKKLPKEVRRMGTLSAIDIFEGSVESIEKLEVCK
jgi:hypothetical protein